MSKHLRTFLLSVLVVVLAASSAMAALTELSVASSDQIVISKVASGTTVSDWTLQIKKDGFYVLPNYSNDKKVQLKEISLDYGVKEAELRLPSLYDGEGIAGAWNIKLGSSQKLSIVKDTNATAAMALAGDYNTNVGAETNYWVIPSGAELVIDVPVRAEGVAQKRFAVNIDITGTFRFGANSSIYGSGGLQADGFIATATPQRSKITVEPKGLFVVESATTLQGALDVLVKSGDVAANDGKIRIATGNHDLKGAKLQLDGVIDVQQDTTITDSVGTNGISISDNGTKITKRGGSTLTLGAGLIEAAKIHKIEVMEGTLHLNGSATYGSINNPTPNPKPSFFAANNDPAVDFVVNKATLKLDRMSVRDGQGVNFLLSNSGKLELAGHAVYKTDTDNLYKEIYPYENYYTKDNSMRIYVTGVVLSADSTSSATINGMQAFNTVRGAGTITVNGDEDKDNGVLILTAAAGATANPGLRLFTGTINGTHANLGLFRGDVAWNAFRSADINVENVIVYGNRETKDNPNTRLIVSGDQTLSRFKDASIYLRSDRPGADNSKQAIAATKLTIGKIRLQSTKLVEGSTVANDAVPYTINSLKVDATAVEANAARLEVGANNQIVNLDKTVLYANKGTDFGGNYNHADGEGMYALMLTASSTIGGAPYSHVRYNWNADELTGDGDANDVDTVYAIQIFKNADVIMKAKTNTVPFGSNNSVLVHQDGKLEVPAGSTIDGNLKLEESSTKGLTMWYQHHNDMPTDNTNTVIADYPREDMFYPNDLNNQKWTTFNGTSNFTVFTTGLNATNRWTNEGGKYAVTVNGDLTISADKQVANTNIYGGNVVIRAKPALNLLEGSEGNTDGITHIGERFKVLGSEGTVGSKDFIPVYNAIYGFRIPTAGADKKGITFELRNDVDWLTLGDWKFTHGGDNFGQGYGHNFEIQIYFDYHRNSAVEPATSGYSAYFGKYEDGIEEQFDSSNIYDENKNWFTLNVDNGIDIGGSDIINVSDDITFEAGIFTRDTARAFITDDKGVTHTGYILMRGTSYQPKMKLAIALAKFGSALNSNRVVPAYKTYTFVREGTYAEAEGILTSAAETTISHNVLIESKDEAVSYFVEAMRKAPAANASLPEFNGTSYVWNKKAAADTYVIKNDLGQEVRVNNVRVILYDGAPYATSTVSYDVTGSATVEEADGGVYFDVPVTALRSTGGKFNADKALAILASREDGNGEISTNPVMFQLYTRAAGNSESEVAELGITVDRNSGNSAEKVYDINYSDLGIGLADASNIQLLKYDVPSWIEFTGHNDTISYYVKTNEIPEGAEGEYTVKILAYVNTNSTTNVRSKVYTFKVNVDSAKVPTISVSPALVEIAGKDVVEMTFTVANATNVNGLNSFTIINLDNAPSTILSALRLNIVGDTSTKITANAEGIKPGTYRFHVEGYDNGTLVYNDFVIVVNEPRAPSVAISEAEDYTNGFGGSPVDGYTYRAVFSGVARDFSGDVPAVTYSMTTGTGTTSELYGYTSGDLYVVEGIARKSTNSEGDVEQSFTVTAKAGNVEGALENSVTFTVSDQAETVTYGSATTLAATSGSHTDVKAGYRVMFPTRTTAAVDAVVLPSWLKPVLSTEDESVAVGIEFAGVAGDLANGSKATVRVGATYTPADGEELAEGDDGSRYYGWDVVYNAKPADFTLTASPTTVNMRPNATQTVTLTHNALGTVTYEVSPEWATVSGTTLTLRPTELGVFTVTVKATDAGRTIGNTAEATVAVTVTSDDNNNPSGPDEPGGPDEPTVEVPVVTAVTRFSDSNVESADVTADRDVTSWAVYVNGSVETWAAITATGARTARVTLNVPSDLPAGTYAITVTATDANGTSSRTSVGSFTVASTDNFNNPGGSSGGCDAGFGAMALAFATPLFLRRRRS